MKMPNWAAAAGRRIKDLWKYFAGGQTTCGTDEPHGRPVKTGVFVDYQGNQVEIPVCWADIDEYMTTNYLGRLGWPDKVVEIPTQDKEDLLLVVGANLSAFGPGSKPKPRRVHITDLTDLREQFRQDAPDVDDGVK
jgi:hypothetical protein